MNTINQLNVLSQNCRCPEQLNKEVDSGKMTKCKDFSSVISGQLVYRGILLLLLLFLFNRVSWTQTPYPNQGPHTVCLGDLAPYGVINSSGSTYTWSIIPLTGGNGTIASGNSNLTSVTWTSLGTCYLQIIENNSQGCPGMPVQILVTVTETNTITLTSAAGTNNQGACLNTTMTNITYATTGATGATVTGLPAGVTSVWAANVVTISGNPTVSGVFNYLVTLTGGCGTVTATGSITVNQLSNPVIVGSNPVCESVNSTTEIYTTANVPGNTYHWTVVGGIFTGQDTNQIAVTWTTPGSGSVSVTETVGIAGCNSSETRVITVQPAPATSNIYHN
jgi:hypothetical protein